MIFGFNGLLVELIVCNCFFSGVVVLVFVVISRWNVVGDLVRLVMFSCWIRLKVEFVVNLFLYSVVVVLMSSGL